MSKFINCSWYDTGTATELASLHDEGAAGRRVRVVCRTAKGSLFGYEMDGTDGGAPMAEALLRFLTISDAVAWMAKQGFTAESIEGVFPDARPLHDRRLAHTDA